MTGGPKPGGPKNAAGTLHKRGEQFSHHLHLPFSTRPPFAFFQALPGNHLQTRSLAEKKRYTPVDLATADRWARSLFLL